MKASLSLRRPTNWPDFESLCKKLWGEIWNCPTIKKNGRIGNPQRGVDVYGIPVGEQGYFGIQCKGKDEYTDKQFTIEEITKEINKAKKFIPPLKAYYLTTTAVKNSTIEEFVRIKNVEHIKLGLFRIELFCWEDIVELIDENKDTLRYFLRSQNYKSQESISITFEDGKNEFFVEPIFKQDVGDYKEKSIMNNQIKKDDIFGLTSIAQQMAMPLPIKLDLLPTGPNFKNTTNYSFFKIKIRIHNNGKDTISNYKVILDFLGDNLKISDTNQDGLLSNISRHYQNVKITSDKSTCEIIPESDVLVSEDVFVSNSIFIRPTPNESKIIIKWKLLSADFKDNGELVVNVKPKIHPDITTIWVADKSQVKTIYGSIFDYKVEE